MSEELKQQRNTTTGLAKHRRIADTFSASRKKEEEDTKLCWGKSRPAGGGWARGRPFSCLWCSIRRPAAVPSFMVFRSLDPHQLLLFQTFFGQTLQNFVIIHKDAAAKMTCRPSSTLESGSESCVGLAGVDCSGSKPTFDAVNSFAPPADFSSSGLSSSPAQLTVPCG